jgi:hypothetical protein
MTTSYNPFCTCLTFFSFDPCFLVPISRVIDLHVILGLNLWACGSTTIAQIKTITPLVKLDLLVVPFKGSSLWPMSLWNALFFLVGTLDLELGGLAIVFIATSWSSVFTRIDVLLSPLLDPLEGLNMLNCEKLGLEGRSRLPTLKGGKGAC